MAERENGNERRRGSFVTKFRHENCDDGTRLCTTTTTAASCVGGGGGKRILVGELRRQAGGPRV